jgi:penicillin-binding protein 2
MRGALAQSCNIYFYTMGNTIGIEPIDEVATSFGLGQDPGSELSTNNGQVASEALKKALYGEDSSWYPADSVVAAIGQSDTQVTPLQLCRYISALANKGTLYKATFLRRAVSADFQTLVQENDDTPEATDLLSASEWQVIYDGMRQCVTEGTAQALSDYPIAVCAKTGTAQHGNGGSDNGAFVCWAPADDPEIAIAIYVEHGASGSNFAGVAEAVLDYYFNSQDLVQEAEIENTMTED